MKKNNIIISLTIVLLIIAIIVGGYFIVKTNSKKKDETNNFIKNTNENEEINTHKELNKKAVVIYFSATGNTKQVAEYIKDEINSDIFEIIPKQKYTSEDLNYGDNNTRATREQNDENARPEIDNMIDISDYDVIFLGYPIWWGDVPKIILSFIDNTNLKGKTVIPFCTSGSSGISTSESTLKLYSGNINWIGGKRFSNSSTREDIKSWIDSLNLDKIKEVNDIGDKNSMNEFVIEVNNRKLVVEAQSNSSVKALLEKLKEGDIIINAQDYGNFEKVGDLGFSLPREDTNITTVAGDIVLYQGDQISLFYNSNSWSYTRLGKIQNVDANELRSILGEEDVTLTLTLKR